MSNGRNIFTIKSNKNKFTYKLTGEKSIIISSAFGLLFCAQSHKHASRASKRRFFSALWQVGITTSALIDCYRIKIRGQKRLSSVSYDRLKERLRINSLLRGCNHTQRVSPYDIRTADKTINLLPNTYILFVGLFRRWYIPRYVGSSLIK